MKLIKIDPVDTLNPTADTSIVERETKFFNNFANYIKELHSIDKACTVRTANELKNEYFYTPDTEFYIAYNDDKKEVGLVIIGTNNNCHEAADVYIKEFYIVPEHRSNHYGQEMFLKVMDIYKPHRICMFVLNKNTIANLFWNKVMWEYGYENVSHLYPYNAEEYLTHKMFERKDT